MCGIVGLLMSDAQALAPRQQLHNMVDTLSHRGPDVQKTWINNGIGFGHARLSIIDLSDDANQPMIDLETGNVIVFNGEIYNYIEIKRELISIGYHFSTNSDTEVILKAYAHWGIDCQNRFNGMWAFAIYNKKAQTLFASRDRMGIKPFIYGITRDKELVFASEAKAIVKEFPEFRQPNEKFLIEFVEHDFFACYKETFHKDLYNLLPGHYFLVKNGQGPRQERYWNWTPSNDFKIMSDAEANNTFKDLLTDSIKLRFRSDVPVGSCLSGGLDSGTIVGLASKLYNKKLHTFSCIYPGSPEFDESTYIKYSVDKFKTIPNYIEPQHDDFIELMQDSIYEQDGPTGGPSILSQRAVMELVGKNVKVVLDGQGADEILGGYHGYFHYSLLSHARKYREAKNFRNLYAYLSSAIKIKNRRGGKIGSLAEHCKQSHNLAKFYTNILETQLNYFSAYEKDDLNTILLEHAFTNLTNLLHYEDRNSMRFSVESRLPFLDYRLIEFAFSLPHNYKIRGGTTKWLLYNTAKDVLPMKVLNRKDKMGFTTPATSWFLKNDNMTYFRQYLSLKNQLFSNLPQSVQDHLVKSFNMLSDSRNSSLTTAIDINGLWRFFTANMWQRTM